jgi:hypothetical protein
VPQRAIIRRPLTGFAGTDFPLLNQASRINDFRDWLVIAAGPSPKKNRFIERKSWLCKSKCVASEGINPFTGAKKDYE